jgi:hypothetical protein
MSPNESRGFRLTVLNPGGHDREQFFPEGAGEAGREHAPVNFHAFAACTHGSFQRETKRALAEQAPVLLLLRGDFRASQRALTDLRKQKRTIAVSLKETGLHQIAQQLRDAGKLQRFKTILAMADGCLAITPEAAEIFRSFRGGRDQEKHVAFIPTPYPVGDMRWDFSRSHNERAGIFVGTREWNVPSRNHLAALLLARDLSALVQDPVTVFNGDGRTGAKLLAALDFPAGRLRVIDRHLAYADYLREVSRHKIVLQLDSSFVPGQVAGDALLCRMPCIGGNGAIDHIAFTETCGFARSIAEIREIAQRLLQDHAYYDQEVADSQRRAMQNLSFAKISRELEEFFAVTDS